MVTLDALEPFRCPTSYKVQVRSLALQCPALQPTFVCGLVMMQDNPKPLPYLQDPAYGSYDINLTVRAHAARLGLWE